MFYEKTFNIEILKAWVSSIGDITLAEMHETFPCEASFNKNHNSYEIVFYIDEYIELLRSLTKKTIETNDLVSILMSQEKITEIDDFANILRPYMDRECIDNSEFNKLFSLLKNGFSTTANLNGKGEYRTTTLIEHLKGLQNVSIEDSLKTIIGKIASVENKSKMIDGRRYPTQEERKASEDIRVFFCEHATIDPSIIVPELEKVESILLTNPDEIWQMHGISFIQSDDGKTIMYINPLSDLVFAKKTGMIQRFAHSLFLFNLYKSKVGSNELRDRWSEFCGTIDHTFFDKLSELLISS